MRQLSAVQAKPGAVSAAAHLIGSHDPFTAAGETQRAELGGSARGRSNRLELA